MQAILNHIWQSTWFAAAAWLLTLALRKNRAQTRYWIWLAASAKFLVPFSLLMWMGSQVSWRTVIVEPAANLPVAVLHEAQGFAAPAPKPSAPRPDVLPEAVIFTWACGFVAICFRWGRRWTRMHADARTAELMHLEMDIEFPIPVKVSASLREPGVLGVLRPVLLLPEGIADRLAPAQLRAILTHELSHVRRRDNLAMSMHAMVQALFWFHPMVWWIGVKLIEERERACDEAVLQSGSDPETYAEGILNVCKLYLAAPVECAAGVTGSNLNRRIEEIMTNRIKPGITGGKKLLLAAAGALTIAGPLAIGLWNAPPIRAQAKAGQFSFATISVKPRPKGDGRYSFPSFLPGGRFVSSAPVVALIAEAYDVPFQGPRLTGGPEWIRGELYDIEATSPQGVFPESLSQTERTQRSRSMLQNLLAVRFKLVARRELKEMPVYTLTVAKGGPKLEEANVDDKDCAAPPAQGQQACHQFNGGRGRGMHGRAVTMADIVNFAENWTDKPFLDKTGLTGMYKVDTEGWLPMEWTLNPPAPGTKLDGQDVSDLPSLFAIFEKMGLKMESQRDKAEIVVIDSIERPTEN